MAGRDWTALRLRAGLGFGHQITNTDPHGLLSSARPDLGGQGAHDILTALHCVAHEEQVLPARRVDDLAF